MGRFHPIIVLSLSLGLVGCSLKAMPTVTAPGATAIGPQAPALAPVKALGTLNLTIRWPRQSVAGFNAQTLPYSTRALSVRVKQDGQVLASRLLTREGTDATASVSLVLETANNLSVEVRAYRETAPDLATALPIALGTATGVNLAPGQATGVKVTLDAQTIPTVTSLGTNVGKVGETLTIQGTNFGSGNVPVEVSFGGVPATSVTRKSETELSVVVPPEAATGRLEVKADGVPSSSNSVFWVLERLELKARGTELYPAQRADRVVYRLGESGNLRLDPTWDRLFPELESGNGTPPSPEWTVSSSAVGTLTAETGLVNGSYGMDFTAGSTYASASVKARLGSIESNSLELVAEDLRLRFYPETLVLGGKGAYSAPMEAVHTFSDGATISGDVAYYQSADPSLIKCVGSRFIAQDYYSRTVIEARAASALLPGQIATGSLRLDNYTTSPFVGGTTGFADGSGTSAKFFNPAGIAADAAGNLLIADFGNHAVRKVTSDGVVTTWASGPALTLYDPSTAGDVSVRGMAVNRAGTVAYSFVGTKLMRITSAGDVSLLAGQETAGYTNGSGSEASFNAPSDLVTDSAGNVYVADRNNHVVRKVTPDGVVTTLAGSGERRRLDGTGSSAAFGDVLGVAIAPDDTLYVLDKMSGYAIRKVTPEGQVSTPMPLLDPVADSLLGADARLVCDDQGNLFITDLSGIYRVYSSGEYVLVAGGSLLTTLDTTYYGIGRTPYFSGPRLVVRKGVGYVVDVLNKVRKLD